MTIGLSWRVCARPKHWTSGHGSSSFISATVYEMRLKYPTVLAPDGDLSPWASTFIRSASDSMKTASLTTGTDGDIHSSRGDIHTFWRRREYSDFYCSPVCIS